MSTLEPPAPIDRTIPPNPATRPGFVLTLGALAAVSATAVDIAIPAQGEIAVLLGEAPAAGAGLVSAYLIGFAAGQMAWGPMSDRYGRLGPLYIALAIFIVAAALSALATTMTVLVASRFIQGLAGGAAPVIARAIARDQGGGPATAKLIATNTMILGGAPLLAPTLGSGILILFEWHALFWFLVLFTGVLLVAIHNFIPADRVKAHDPNFQAIAYLRQVGPILVTKDFLFGMWISAFIFFGYASILGVGAAMAEEHFDVAPEAFGPLFATAAAFFVAGSIFARSALPKLGPDTVLTIAAVLAAGAGGALYLMAEATPPLWAMWGAVSIYMLSFGCGLPSGATKALEPAGAAAGAASSVIGAIGTLMGGLGSWLAGAGILGDTYTSICLIMAIGGMAAFVIQAMALILKPRP